MKINKNVILKDYNKLKKIAKRNLSINNMEAACFYTQKAATLMYNYNLIYSDDELEDFLRIVASKIIDATSYKTIESKRIVFYDYFVIDNRGLTEQYLEGLFNSDYEFMFIGCQNNEKSSNIYAKLKNHNIQIEIIHEYSEIEKAKHIASVIDNYKPEIIISHLAPWDIAGLVAISAFNNICKRYLINITDHAYWLGKNCFDYFFEFRDYGFNISKYERGINENKLLKLPYYPIVNTEIKFQGFDFETEGKKIIFSGGNIYKIQGSSKFFEIIKYVLDKYNDTVFLFLGSGDNTVINQFIKKNHYENRFFYRAERKDIYEVFKRCYLYLNTYPLIGGLMTQYACIAGKLPLTLNDKQDLCDNIYELMIDHFSIDLQFDNINALKKSIDFYLENPDSLNDLNSKIKRAVISKDHFNELFCKYLDNPKNVLAIKDYKVDTYNFSEQYLLRFNENKKTYYKIFMTKDLKTVFSFFRYYVLYFINILLENVTR